MGTGEKKYAVRLNMKTLAASIHDPECKIVKQKRRPFEVLDILACSPEEARVLWRSQNEGRAGSVRICACAIHVSPL